MYTDRIFEKQDYHYFCDVEDVSTKPHLTEGEKESGY